MDERPPTLAALSAAVLASQTSAGSERRVLERAHSGLAKVLGPSGIDALIARALRLAQRSDDKLAPVTLAPGGVLQNLPEGDVEPLLLALLVQLFELLARFIGEDLARRIIRDIWPDAAGDSPDLTETKR
jgi:hypothetical protein